MNARRNVRLRRPSRTVVAWVSLFAAAGVLRVWLHLQITQVGYDLSAIRALAKRLAAERGELEAELATLTAPGALDAAARTRLGLRQPRDGQIVGMP